MLHLVRHGPSRPEPMTAAEHWELTETAELACTALRESGVLPSSARWVSSPEPKAMATARLLTSRRVEIDERLKEQVRDATWFGDPDQFADVVRRAFASPEQRAKPGWEPLADTCRRVTGAVVDLAAGQAELVLVGHGAAWTVAVAALTGSPPDVEAWSRLTMPDHCALDVSTGRVISQWGQWRLEA